MIPISIRYGNHAINVFVEKKIVNDIIRLNGDYMQMDLGVKIEGCWEIYGLASISDNQKIGEHLIKSDEDGLGMECYIDKENHRISVVQPDMMWLPLQVSRMVRNIMKWLWSEDGFIFMHSSIVSVNNSGIACMGRKKSGKTSTLFVLLGIKGVSYCSNDDLAIKPEEDGTFWAYGWPRSLCVRQDSMKLLSHLFPKAEIIERHHPGNNDKVNSSKNHYLYPYEIAEVTGKRIVAKTKLKCIIFPCFEENSQTRVEQLTSSEALKYLKENLELIPEKKCRSISHMFVPYDKNYAFSVLENMANDLLFFRLHQSFNALEYSKHILENLCNDFL